MVIAEECICCGSTTLERSPAVLMPFVAKRAFGWEPVEITAEWGLRDIKRGMAYPLCNSLRCTVCGVVFLDIRFSEGEMRALYDGYRGEKYTALREWFEPGYRQRNAKLSAGIDYLGRVEKFLSKHVRPPLRILDWGGDGGLNTPFKREANVALDVYDISNKPVAGAASAVDLSTIEVSTYDLVILSNVLEHVPLPSLLLPQIACVMQSETILYIEVPHEDLVRRNVDKAGLVTLKRHWHEHINFFNQRALELLLNRCGFEVIDFQSLNVTVAGKEGCVFSLACKLR